MGDDVIDLAAPHGPLDQGPGGRGPEPATAELRGDLVADLDARDSWQASARPL
jgi:hypothetical protein